ncbi:mannan endo-1,6-alpha-mannosidase [Sporothrix brasiliensis 5110]|uniref:Mannan endo-1,6-alpha-mannosidase n=1 Tax=Sporothrix brasiliensis 5110 TaxID=1398154 RepID=A0A0C2IC26_9PEZI|nr:mannan endo-1,6-alpha-mannosidase [Sporothrix brasiliensis 5110]KIH86846.1 mannan endo-1,6-alpha-mannosidase [Sporothrix brasiliensis 5110]
MWSTAAQAVVAGLLATGTVVEAASQFSISSSDAIKKTASTIAHDLVSYYHGNESGQTPGILPGPPPAGDYYWWEAGAMWGTLIDYWHLTGDDTYNELVTEAMLFQTGPHEDYMPPNVTASLGNDDQGFWGMSAMLAAEVNFPNPPADKPQWLALAQAVFNTQAEPGRHDATCNGGLRWQIPVLNNGYNYKNSIANGCFFNIGARLARYTDNATYADWAERTWDWIEGVGYMDAEYNIYDGAHVETNCTDINKAQFSYNSAVWLLGAAYMWNHTEEAKWQTRVEGLLNRTITFFFPDGVAYEVACETHMTCTTDMLTYKGFLHRWMASTAQVAPFTHDRIMAVLQTSTQAAVDQCTGGDNGRTCGFQWSSRAFDGSVGAGQTMNVLAAVSSLLVDEVHAPLTNQTGGTSVGNPNAGSGSVDNPTEFAPITAADRAGAGILTVFVLAGITGLFTMMSFGE